MRYLIFVWLSMTAALSMLIAAGGCTSLEAGTEIRAEKAVYGEAMGYRGIIRVRVSLDEGTITDITVLESSEDWNVGEAAIAELTDLALMYNTTELDVISGATETSRGFLKSIENAIMNL